MSSDRRRSRSRSKRHEADSVVDRPAPRAARVGTILALVLGPLVLVSYLAWQALASPSITFLARDAPADWITFPTAPSTESHPRLEMPAEFVRTFDLDSIPQHARLRVRFDRSGAVTINGRAVALSPDPGNWKTARESDVTSLLVSGRNRIVATAAADFGPPALWLTLTTDSLTISSDANWTATIAGSAERPARMASTPMSRWADPTEASVSGAIHSDVLNPSPLHGLRTKAVPIAGFAVLAGLLTLGLQRLVRGRPFVFDRRTMLVVIGVLAAAYGALFWNNRALSLDHGFDAFAHVEYVNHLLKTGTVPMADQGWEMYQPPLYYGLAAVALQTAGYSVLDASSMHVVRAMGWLALVLQIVFVMQAARLLLKGRPNATALAVAVAAALPLQLYLFQYVTNEAITGMFVSLSIWLALRILARGSTRVVDHAVLGAALGAALLTKVSALLALAAIVSVLAARLAAARERRPLVWLRSVATVVAVAFAVCGWYYLRVHARFGHFLVTNFDVESGFRWWQDPGYHTLGYYTGAGESLVRTTFSALYSFADGLYSTLWGDGLIGGVARIDTRPPWNYEFMSAGLVLGLILTAAFVAGLVLVIVRLVRHPRAPWFLVVGLQVAMLAALVTLTLRLPFYNQAKAVFASGLVIPFAVTVAVGLDAVSAWRRWLQPIVWTVVGTWMFVCGAAFWSAQGLAEQRIPPSNPDVWFWNTADAGSAAHGGLAALEKSVALAADNAEAHTRLAVARLQLGDVAGAVTAGRDGLAVSPWSARAHYILGLAYGASGDPARSIEHLGWSARIEPYTSFYTLDLARALMEAGRWDDAERTLVTARAALVAHGVPVDAAMDEQIVRARRKGK